MDNQQAREKTVPNEIPVSRVNHHLAHRQHLLPRSQPTQLVQVTRDIAALHATGAAGPYLSLWARVAGFQRRALEEALYNRRELVRLLCMRTTLHLVASDEMPFFHQAYLAQRGPIELRDTRRLLVQAGLVTEREAGALLEGLQRQVLDFLTEKGPSTVRQINSAVPELQARVRYDEDKSYGGEFSVGSRLVPSMCALGLLVRARARGTWRSNLYEYATFAEWLPNLDLESVTPMEARTWLVRRYLSAFGPATIDDVQWWTGFSRGRTEEALTNLNSELAEVAIEGLGNEHLMLVDVGQTLRAWPAEGGPSAFFLPSLDPYIMGYKDRRRFLAVEHHDKVFDRAGNAMPTVWVDGSVVGAWLHRKDGRVVFGLFEPVRKSARARLETKRLELERFLGDEYLPVRTHTTFTRILT
ncbi:winged helix DNA-binding domain-containing protein [Chloroflexota bacterium]